jgi:serine phosphatase RsbU (regulator of sigma subunit)
VHAEHGDTLILYTDGLLDAHAGDDDAVGVERLVARVSANLATGEPVRAWLPAIVAAAPNQGSDDIAVVALALEGVAAVAEAAPS